MSWNPFSRWHLDPPYDDEPYDGDPDEYDVPDYWWGDDLNEHFAALDAANALMALEHAEARVGNTKIERAA